MRVRFGPFEFDSATRELLQDRQPVHLSPKSFDLLQILIEQRPALVTKSELQDRLWPEAPVLEGPEIISLEEAEEGASDVPAEEDEEIGDLGEEAAEIPAGDDENAFLEEEEEGEADVSGIVGGDKNEEG